MRRIEITGEEILTLITMSSTACAELRTQARQLRTVAADMEKIGATSAACSASISADENEATAAEYFDLITALHGRFHDAKEE